MPKEPITIVIQPDGSLTVNGIALGPYTLNLHSLQESDGNSLILSASRSRVGDSNVSKEDLAKLPYAKPTFSLTTQK